ncbi:MAG TPA: glycosyl hydrolase, partial [Steroidobacteraceae bacterium]|nr:glycosyl hydrolase [Steroidobacteraceae bacterium]
MDGQVTREGIRRDLEWMQRVGIGGVVWLNNGLRLPQGIDPRLPYDPGLPYMSPAWQDAAR